MNKYLPHLEKAKKYYPYLGIIMIALYILSNFPTSDVENSTRAKSADTYIPAGYVLVPIEIVNREALQSILGSYGVVDLYIPGSEKIRSGKKVASRVKILRAPLNPEEFAVLVKENEASQLIPHEDGYFVVVQNPNQTGTRLVKPLLRRSRISFEDG